MNEVGLFALSITWLLTLVATLTGSFAGARRLAALAEATRRATIAAAGMGALSLGSLAYLFLVSDFSNQYVWQFSNRDMYPIYKFTAIWGGMDGSMLLWAVMLTLVGGIFSVTLLGKPQRLSSYSLAVLNLNSLFFLSVVLFFTNPFRYLAAPSVLPDGNGLNPLLQNPYMAIHPPTLYAGFTTFVVPYALCVGALLVGDSSNDWLRLARRWTLIAWGFLSAGIVLGGHWAYLELGWGGFWAWDPVENASFLPWLTGTAFLHSVMVQERKNMLKMWNVWLIVITFALTVFGTFLTRSGIVQSVHAFASTEIGEIFLYYLIAILVAVGVVTFWRRRLLQSERALESLLSREAVFVFQNLIFLSIAFATAWGTLFPVFSELLTGQRLTVGIPFFNAVTAPLFLLMLLMMGVGPLIAWRKASWTGIVQLFLKPFIAGLGVSLFLLWGGITHPRALLAYGLVTFVFLTIVGELYRGARAQRGEQGQSLPLPRGIVALLKRHGTRFAGHLVHVGVLVMTVAITASLIHKHEEEFTLTRGQSINIGRYNLTLDGLDEGEKRNYVFAHAVVNVRDAFRGAPITILHPELRLYKRNQETTTEVALHMTWRDDLYVVLAGIEDEGAKAAFKVYVNPLQKWLWTGTAIMLFGTILVMLPRRRTTSATIPTGQGGSI